MTSDTEIVFLSQRITVQLSRKAPTGATFPELSLRSFSFSEEGSECWGALHISKADVIVRGVETPIALPDTNKCFQCPFREGQGKGIPKGCSVRISGESSGYQDLNPSYCGRRQFVAYFPPPVENVCDFKLPSFKISKLSSQHTT